MRIGAKRLSAALVVLVAVSLGRPLAAQMPETPPGKWWKRPRIVQLLNLSADQQSKLEDVFARHRRDFVDLKADVERHQIDVEELVAKKDSDAKKVASAVDALEQARLKLHRAATMMFLEQKDVLSAAQWQQVLERRDQWRRERQMERRGMSGDGEGGARPDRLGPDRPGQGVGRERRAPRPGGEKPPETPPDR